ncbi:PX domain-containing protein [Phytophthora infestans]|uniref:PX domain-containing protein n=1 Tax=Phytophthora infestans TaxID=4787 RepID=A0A8S9UBJ8_PHYIN|nr:PX domain-containing protein [Phytophthora infestans]
MTTTKLQTKNTNVGRFNSFDAVAERQISSHSSFTVDTNDAKSIDSADDTTMDWCEFYLHRSSFSDDMAGVIALGCGAHNGMNTQVADFQTVSAGTVLVSEETTPIASDELEVARTLYKLLNQVDDVEVCEEETVELVDELMTAEAVEEVEEVASVDDTEAAMETRMQEVPVQALAVGGAVALAAGATALALNDGGVDDEQVVKVVEEACNDEDIDVEATLPEEVSATEEETIADTLDTTEAEESESAVDGGVEQVADDETVEEESAVEPALATITEEIEVEYVELAPVELPVEPMSDEEEEAVEDAILIDENIDSGSEELVAEVTNDVIAAVIEELIVEGEFVAEFIAGAEEIEEETVFGTEADDVVEAVAEDITAKVIERDEVTESTETNDTEALCITTEKESATVLAGSELVADDTNLSLPVEIEANDNIESANTDISVKEAFTGAEAKVTEEEATEEAADTATDEVVEAVSEKQIETAQAAPTAVVTVESEEAAVDPTSVTKVGVENAATPSEPNNGFALDMPAIVASLAAGACVAVGAEEVMQTSSSTPGIEVIALDEKKEAVDAGEETQEDATDDVVEASGAEEDAVANTDVESTEAIVDTLPVAVSDVTVYQAADAVVQTETLIKNEQAVVQSIDHAAEVKAVLEEILTETAEADTAPVATELIKEDSTPPVEELETKGTEVEPMGINVISDMPQIVALGACAASAVSLTTRIEVEETDNDEAIAVEEEEASDARLTDSEEEVIDEMVAATVEEVLSITSSDEQRESLTLDVDGAAAECVEDDSAMEHYVATEPIDTVKTADVAGVEAVEVETFDDEFAVEEAGVETEYATEEFTLEKATDASASSESSATEADHAIQPAVDKEISQDGVVDTLVVESVWEEPLSVEKEATIKEEGEESMASTAGELPVGEAAKEGTTPTGPVVDESETSVVKAKEEFTENETSVEGEPASNALIATIEVPAIEEIEEKEAVDVKEEATAAFTTGALVSEESAAMEPDAESMTDEVVEESVVTAVSGELVATDPGPDDDTTCTTTEDAVSEEIHTKQTCCLEDVADEEPEVASTDADEGTAVEEPAADESVPAHDAATELTTPEDAEEVSEDTTPEDTIAGATEVPKSASTEVEEDSTEQEIAVVVTLETKASQNDDALREGEEDMDGAAQPIAEEVDAEPVEKNEDVAAEVPGEVEAAPQNALGDDQEPFIVETVAENVVEDGEESATVSDETNALAKQREANAAAAAKEEPPKAPNSGGWLKNLLFRNKSTQKAALAPKPKIEPIQAVKDDAAEPASERAAETDICIPATNDGVEVADEPVLDDLADADREVSAAILQETPIDKKPTMETAAMESEHRTGASQTGSVETEASNEQKTLTTEEADGSSDTDSSAETKQEVERNEKVTSAEQSTDDSVVDAVKEQENEDKTDAEVAAEPSFAATDAVNDVPAERVGETSDEEVSVAIEDAASELVNDDVTEPETAVDEEGEEPAEEEASEVTTVSVEKAELESVDVAEAVEKAAAEPESTSVESRDVASTQSEALEDEDAVQVETVQVADDTEVESTAAEEIAEPLKDEADKSGLVDDGAVVADTEDVVEESVETEAAPAPTEASYEVKEEAPVKVDDAARAVIIETETTLDEVAELVKNETTETKPTEEEVDEPEPASVAETTQASAAELEKAADVEIVDDAESAVVEDACDSAKDDDKELYPVEDIGAVTESPVDEPAETDVLSTVETTVTEAVVDEVTVANAVAEKEEVATELELPTESNADELDEASAADNLTEVADSEETSKEVVADSESAADDVVESTAVTEEAATEVDTSEPAAEETVEVVEAVVDDIVGEVVEEVAAEPEAEASKEDAARKIQKDEETESVVEQELNDKPGVETESLEADGVAVDTENVTEQEVANVKTETVNVEADEVADQAVVDQDDAAKPSTEEENIEVEPVATATEIEASTDEFAEAVEGIEPTSTTTTEAVAEPAQDGPKEQTSVDVEPAADYEAVTEEAKEGVEEAAEETPAATLVEAVKVAAAAVELAESKPVETPSAAVIEEMPTTSPPVSENVAEAEFEVDTKPISAVSMLIGRFEQFAKHKAEEAANSRSSSRASSRVSSPLSSPPTSRPRGDVVKAVDTSVEEPAHVDPIKEEAETEVVAEEQETKAEETTDEASKAATAAETPAAVEEEAGAAGEKVEEVETLEADDAENAGETAVDEAPGAEAEDQKTTPNAKVEADAVTEEIEGEEGSVAADESAMSHIEEKPADVESPAVEAEVGTAIAEQEPKAVEVETAEEEVREAEAAEEPPAADENAVEYVDDAASDSTRETQTITTTYEAAETSILSMETPEDNKLRDDEADSTPSDAEETAAETDDAAVATADFTTNEAVEAFEMVKEEPVSTEQPETNNELEDDTSDLASATKETHATLEESKESPADNPNEEPTSTERKMSSISPQPPTVQAAENTAVTNEDTAKATVETAPTSLTTKVVEDDATAAQNTPERDSNHLLPHEHLTYEILGVTRANNVIMYHIYTVNSATGEQSMSIPKRYSEFKLLAERLRALNIPATHDMPELPKPTVGTFLRGRRSKKTIEMREKAFGEFLYYISQHEELHECAVFQQFIAN